MVHIAVLLEQYLSLILSGRKTIECRLTVQARDPYERIEPGERIYFKQSAGPYGATAIVEHVMFEEGLTQRRIKEIRRDYNEMICGEPAYWDWKRDASYCTLIWLKDVQGIDSGPAIRPLQGVAWLMLEEEPVWRRVEMSDGKLFRGTVLVEITPGNLRNNSLYLTSVIDQFPKWAIGGRNKSAAARPIRLSLHEGPTVETDIVGPRNMLRTRVWGSWFRRHGVRAGDRVVFNPLSKNEFSVGLARLNDS